MKNFAARFLSILFLATTLLASNVYPDRSVQYDDCCKPSCCYECSCNPLYCGALDLQLQVGAAPILWKDREHFNIIQCPGLSVGGTPSIFELFEIPKFSSFYKVPWTIGGQVGYALSDNIRVYLEVNYLQAKAKRDAELVSAPFNLTGTVVANSLAFNVGKYRLVDAYVGARYYFDRWCDRVSFFLGFKAGLVHRRHINFNVALLNPTPPAPVVIVPETPEVNFFGRNTVPSGGLNFGLDFCFCGCWSFVLTGEIVASCGPKSNGNIAFNQPGAGCDVLGPQPVLPGPVGLNINNLLIGHIGTELRFPITAAVRYSF